jgi:hypothetical protein
MTAAKKRTIGKRCCESRLDQGGNEMIDTEELYAVSNRSVY